MNDRRTFVRVFFVLVSFGVVSLLGMLARPSLATIRMVDVVHLVGTGMCFGAAIVALVAHRRGLPQERAQPAPAADASVIRNCTTHS